MTERTQVPEYLRKLIETYRDDFTGEADLVDRAAWYLLTDRMTAGQFGAYYLRLDVTEPEVTAVVFLNGRSAQCSCRQWQRSKAPIRDKCVHIVAAELHQFTARAYDMAAGLIVTHRYTDLPGEVEPPDWLD